MRGTDGAFVCATVSEEDYRPTSGDVLDLMHLGEMIPKEPQNYTIDAVVTFT